ncbi:unnamed protein product [Cunninghamella blakesleeana]
MASQSNTRDNNGFQVVPFIHDDELLDDSSIQSEQVHLRQRNNKATTSSTTYGREEEEEEEEMHTRRNKKDKYSYGEPPYSLSGDIREEEEVEGEEGEELPPLELHPMVIFIGTLIKKITMPFIKVIFAPKAQRTMIKSAIFMVVFVWILLTSITAYLTFYQHYVPRTLHKESIYFQYGHVGERNLVEPFGLVDFTNGYSKAPLRHEQAYNVYVQLHVPTSDINFNLGNFMVDVKLLTQDNTVLAHSSRPGILRYQSHTQRIIHVLAKAFPLLIGFTEESQIVIVPLIEGYIEQKSNPFVKASVAISNPDLQIYDAQISIRADFRGLRYYMYYRRIPTAIAFIILFMIIEFIFTTIAWKKYGQHLWFKLQDLFEEAALEQQAYQQQLAERESLQQHRNRSSSNLANKDGN